MKTSTLSGLALVIALAAIFFYSQQSEESKETSGQAVEKQTAKPKSPGSDSRAVSGDEYLNPVAIPEGKTRVRNMARRGGQTGGAEKNGGEAEMQQETPPQDLIGQPIESKESSRFDRGRRDIETRLTQQMGDGKKAKMQAVLENKDLLQRQSIEEKWQERGWGTPPQELEDVEQELLRRARNTPKNDDQTLKDIYTDLTTINPSEPDYRTILEDKILQTTPPGPQATTPDLQNNPAIPEKSKQDLQEPLPTDFVANDKISFAVKHLDGGNFYVWIKNTSSETIPIDPNYFSLIGANGQKYRYLRDDAIRKDLKPNEEIKGGFIGFFLSDTPKEIIFSNSIVGSLTQPIPQPPPSAGK